MKTKYKTIILTAFLLGGANALYPATVTTKDDKTYEGKIKDDTSVEVVLVQNNGTEIRIPKNNIENIDYTETQEESNRFKRSYPIFGATVGTPAGINLSIGYTWPVLGFQLSGLYLGNIYGAQLNILFKLSETKNFSHALFLGGGFSQVTGMGGYDFSWYYGAAGYNLNFFGIFAELGLSVGTGTFKNPQLTFQLGYVHRFNRF